MVERQDITGLILAGGRGSRMGGVDKGLQLLDGRPLAGHVLARLRPQVDVVMVSANRNAEAYAALGCQVVADADNSFSGPLSGLLAGLRACSSDWLLSAPCDAPLLPADLAAWLAATIDDSTDIAVPLTADGRLQPVFCLLRRSLSAELERYLNDGGRKVETWMAAQRLRRVPFDRPDDERAFFNANTLAELHTLERSND
ncbi:molybdenum cofactor guanylyltransferase MobA [Paucibacter sp. R3-3]|uniref:Molybdenum cofactor guanylyltransferase n=1 Tax=Roseateles agri TaxID=3098619 RepID=A0ABU5DR42_9BURK|nr:molybdenum cofactor guanylyltransferase MobA [Paucibacter sp. R3-3]MDY0748203.1 molybdenum cofactor guanylyltransferase MobA [Paucibacter sp. R3-3]